MLSRAKTKTFFGHCWSQEIRDLFQFAERSSAEVTVAGTVRYYYEQTD